MLPTDCENKKPGKFFPRFISFTVRLFLSGGEPVSPPRVDQTVAVRFARARQIVLRPAR